MNFAALWARNPGRATPSLRCTPKAPIKETRQDATYLQREAVQTSGASSDSPCHAHHLAFAQARGLSLKVSDEFTVPLYVIHHNALHSRD